MQSNIFSLVIASFLLFGCGSGDNATTKQTEAKTSASVQLDSEDVSSAGDILKEVKAETKPSNWYIRIVAQDLSRGLKSDRALLGALDESDAVQKHTLGTYAKFDGHLDVLFVDPVGVKAGQYKTNYHSYAENTEDEWIFTVMSDDTIAEMSLSWKGLYVLTPYVDSGRTLYREYRSTSNPLIKNMKLIDMQTMQEIPAVYDGKVQVFTFNMDGMTERQFKWVVTREEVNIAPVTSNVSVQKPMSQTMSRTMDTSKQKAVKAESIDLDNPPFLKERR